MKPTYALVRLGKLLLGAVNDKLVSILLVHVALNPVKKTKMSQVRACRLMCDGVAYLVSLDSQSSAQLPTRVLWLYLGPPDNCYGVKYIFSCIFSN